MIVVTGAAGFIGKHLMRCLLEKTPHDILALDNLSRGNWNGFEENGRVSLITGDVRDVNLLNRIMDGAEIVFHLAGQSTVLGAILDIDSTFSSNVIGTYNVMRASERGGVRHVVFTSSREVYGEPKSIPVTEDFPLAAKNPYGASKIACEAFCRIFDSDEMHVSVLRLANAYGFGDHDRVIPIFIECALKDDALVINGGEQVIDFVPVDLVVESLWRVANRPLGRPVNVGTGVGTTLQDLATRIIGDSGSLSTIEYSSANAMEVTRFVADVTRMEDALGIIPPEDPLAYLKDQIITSSVSMSIPLRSEFERR
ncbi:MAG: NAD-dependent epimerase/dehydratase family protein [Anaerolineales bacterium]|nr:NAD-dependent epimerase/dehydratase family protein [Anaerolineales bacterium]